MDTQIGQGREPFFDKTRKALNFRQKDHEC